MAEEMNNCNISLDMSKKEVLCDVITMKVPNIFILPQSGSYFEISSQSFEFQNASWCFVLRSQKKKKGCYSRFKIFMKRIKSRTWKQKIFYKITLLDANDKNYHNFVYTFNSYTDVEENEMSQFSNEKPSLDRRDTLTFIIHLFQFDELTKQDTDNTSHTQDLQDKRTEKENDCKILLKFSRKSITFDVCTLKFFNVAREHDGTEFEWKSPSFEFDNETWCFELQPQGEYFEVYMLRLSSEKKKHNKKIDKEQELIFLSTLQVNGKEFYKHFDNKKYLCYNNTNKYLAGIFSTMRRNDATCDRMTLILYLVRNKSFEVNATNMPLTIIRDLDALSDDFKVLFDNKVGCDTTLCVEDKEYKVHKTVLMARSTVFAAMFQHDTKEKQTGTVDIHDCEPESFKQFLEYLYSGKLEEASFSFHTAFHLYSTSDKYNVLTLKMFCLNYLMQCITTENICDIFILADNYNETELLARGQDFFNRNADRILETSQWELLTKDNYSLTKRIIINMTRKRKFTDS